MKIMIVDDEELIRNHLAHLTEWDEIGCQITGVAANGVEALKRIPADKPDLIITDIRMPLMNGIQLAEQIKVRFPHIRFLFLTAYSDFQYAQHAVKLGAADFILKPIQNAELLHAVELIVQGEERISREDRLKQEQVIQAMLSPVAVPDKYEVALEQRLEDREIIVICVVIDNADVLAEAGEVYSWVALREAVTQILHYNPYSYWDYTDSKGVYLILFKPHGDLWDMRVDSMKMAGEMLERCKDSFPFAVSICISKVKSSIVYLDQAWKEIKDCLDYRMLLGKGSIISNDALPQLVKGNINGAENQLNELTVMLRKGEKEKVPSYLLSISREMMGKGLTKTNIHTFALQVVQKVETLLLEYNLRIPEEIQLHTRKTILSFDILFDLMIFLEQWVEEAADRIIAIRQNHSVNGLVKEICAYIRSKSAEDMTLERLADDFHMNHSYLSRLIKKETGHNFRDLLWSYRIEDAKRMLLETRLKANEIAYEVGFKDPAHFSLLFKKHVGLSPMNYREQIKP